MIKILNIGLLRDLSKQLHDAARKRELQQQAAKPEPVGDWLRRKVQAARKAANPPH